MAYASSLYATAEKPEVGDPVPSGAQLANLVFRGRSDYRDTRMLDGTRVRFLTRSSADDLFASSYLRIERLQVASGFGSVRNPRLSRAPAVATEDFAHGGFAVRGTT